MASNFTAHAESCTSRPKQQSWEVFQASAARVLNGLPPLAEVTAPTPVDAQHDMMQAFIQRGIDNPAKSVTQRSYREHLTIAIVRDDLAFRLTENDGMFELLTHILPARVKARVSHQTIARDLKTLHDTLDKKLETMIKVC